MQGLGCMKLVDSVDMKSKGLVMQSVQLDHDALLEGVCIPGTWRNSSVSNNHFVQSKCKLKYWIVTCWYRFCQRHAIQKGHSKGPYSCFEVDQMQHLATKL
jgi:hypothetical protein